jgi:DNA polymerase elongation subunit (family B)
MFNRTPRKFVKERVLLSWFLANFINMDPDLLLTHDTDDLYVLQQKMIEFGIPNWSRIGRVRMHVPKRYNNIYPNKIVGRLTCDTKTSAEELVGVCSDTDNPYKSTDKCLQMFKITKTTYVNPLRNSY